MTRISLFPPLWIFYVALCLNIGISILALAILIATHSRAKYVKSGAKVYFSAKKRQIRNQELLEWTWLFILNCDRNNHVSF